MKYFISFVLFILLFSCSKTHNGADNPSDQSLKVHFKKTSFSETLTKAKQENKMILMDIYATWCVPCQKLDKTVFSDNEMGEFINSKFVSLKVDGEKGEGPDLMEKFSVPGYPTIILLTENGEEIDRLVGFGGDKEEYFQTIQDYLEGKNTLKDYLARLENENDNVELNYKIATKYLYREEQENAIKYYQRVLTLDPEDENGYKDYSLYQIASSQTELKNNPQPLHDFIKNSANEDYVKRAYSSLTRFYRNQKNYDKLISTYEECLTRFPKDTHMMNGYAWDIFRLKLKDQYQRGIGVTQKAVELEPDNAAIWDTLGQLEFEAGNVQEAIEAMQKAADLEPETESFRENLERYKKSLIKT